MSADMRRANELKKSLDGIFSTNSYGRRYRTFHAAFRRSRRPAGYRAKRQEPHRFFLPGNNPLGNSVGSLARNLR
ncbi:MAG TPA: hypothetical protein VI565_06115, partial [Burkholderiales bacterium]|nr:hypothetical protein [Burkholderiales bacterium]